MQNNQDDIKNVVIVDDEKSFMASLIAGLDSFLEGFRVHGAYNGKEAVNILESTSVDLVVTDLKMPEMDGFELLAYMSKYFPSVPVVVMSAYGTPKIKRRLEILGSFGFLEKPLGLSELAQAIIHGVVRGSDAGSMKGISIGSFLQLIAMEQKTCLLEISADGKDRKGFFYFNKGELYDAINGDLKGEGAAIEMISWNNAEIKLKNLPPKKIRQQIKRDLAVLILNAAHLKDESCGIGADGFSGIDEIAELTPDDLVLEEDIEMDEIAELTPDDLVFEEDAGTEKVDELIDGLNAEAKPEDQEGTEPFFRTEQQKELIANEPEISINAVKDGDAQAKRDLTALILDAVPLKDESCGIGADGLSGIDEIAELTPDDLVFEEDAGTEKVDELIDGLSGGAKPKDQEGTEPFFRMGCFNIL